MRLLEAKSSEVGKEVLLEGSISPVSVKVRPAARQSGRLVGSR